MTLWWIGNIALVAVFPRRTCCTACSAPRRVIVPSVEEIAKTAAAGLE